MKDGKNVMVEIRIEEGENVKYTKLQIEESNELDRLVIMQGIFKALSIDMNIKDVINDYIKFGEAYQTFYTSVKTEEDEREVFVKKPTDTTEKEIVPIPNEEEWKQALQSMKSEIESESQQAESNAENLTSHKNDDVPDHYRTGIKETSTGKLYQVRLHCTQCLTRKTFFIPPTERKVYCRNCNTMYVTRPAKKEVLKPDSMNNFFIAGGITGEDEI